ncbi:MAG: hypothetical protein POELPBGB_00922 [Bacteroidia bacterium]|nr:hypothetical protein [Bacteroidia bacterium]
MKLSQQNHTRIDAYLLANKALLFLMLLLLLYLIFMSCFDIGFACQHKIFFGTECRSCGLTRGLWSCMKLDFATANKFNTQSTFIFISIICQILFRFLLVQISMVHQFLKHRNFNTLFSIDISVIVILFIVNMKYYG